MSQVTAAEIIKAIPHEILASLILFFDDPRQQEMSINKGDRQAKIKYYKTIKY